MDDKNKTTRSSEPDLEPCATTRLCEGDGEALAERETDASRPTEAKSKPEPVAEVPDDQLVTLAMHGPQTDSLQSTDAKANLKPDARLREDELATLPMRKRQTETLRLELSSTAVPQVERCEEELVTLAYFNPEDDSSRLTYPKPGTERKVKPWEDGFKTVRRHLRDLGPLRTEDWKIEQKPTPGSVPSSSTPDGLESRSALPQIPQGAENSRSSQIIDGRYEVCSCLGQGAMGAVYEVRHIRLDKRFALKIIHPRLAKDKAAVARFQREAASLSRIEHPNCVGITDFGQTPNGDFYLVMERVEGEILSDAIGKGPFPLWESLEITRQVLSGLGHAHKAGIIHRDIKLQNLIKAINEDGSFTIKILDFGMAKEKISKQGNKRITEAGVVLGTPQYLAPEVVLTQTMNQQTDIYAVGVALFTLLTGQRVFPGEEIGEIMQAKLKNPAPRLNDVGCGEFPTSLENFLIKALSDPKIRFQNVPEMQAALQKVSEEVWSTKPNFIILAREKIKPATLAVTKQGRMVSELVKQCGKEISAHIGSTLQEWLKRPSSWNGAAWMKRIADLRKLFALRVGDLSSAKKETKDSSKKESDENR